MKKRKKKKKKEINGFDGSARWSEKISFWANHCYIMSRNT